MEGELITRWPGIESNPEVMTEFAAKLGLETSLFRFCDVFPLLAFILCVPIDSKAEFANIPTLLPATDALVKSTFFLEQISALDDACGTIAMIHSMLNNTNVLDLKSGPLVDFKKATDALIQSRNLSDLKAMANLRGIQLASNKTLASLHTSSSQQGQTEAVGSGQTNHHFICFTQVGEYVVEFDGCKSQPRFLAKISAKQGFVEAAADVIKRVYFSNPNVVDFSLVALAANTFDD